MKLKPMADNVLLKAHEAPETTVSGIVLATTNKEKPMIYEVVSVGPGTKDVTMTVKAGEKVVVAKFTGNDVTAWVEIKLDGYGWVAFYPTPKETKVPDENQNLTPPNPQTLVRQPPVPLTDPLRDDNQAKGKTSLGGSMADETPTSLFWQRFGRIVRKVAIYGSPLWTVLIVCGLLLAIKSIALARARRQGSASAQL